MAKKKIEIKKLEELYSSNKLLSENVKCERGIYIFWWHGNIKLFDNRKYNLKGPSGKLQTIQITQNWIEKATHNKLLCLYVGKTTTIKSRISKHIKIKNKSRLFKDDDEMLKKHNTESQLRYGLERIFPEEKLMINFILKNVSVSFHHTDDEVTSIDRFYAENHLIGKYHPLLNLDIER